MSREDSISPYNQDLLQDLAGKYLCAANQLHRARTKRQKRKLQERVQEVKIYLAWALLDCGKYEEGLAMYNSVHGSQYRETKYNGIGRALTEMKRYGEARTILGKGLKEFPESSALWICLGNLNEVLGDHSGALICFETAIRCDSDDSHLFYNKALALAGLGSYADAISILDQLIEEYPDDPMYLSERGNLLLQTRYPLEALRDYRKAMALFSECPEIRVGVSIYAGFCSAYLELGMEKDALETALEGLKRFPDTSSVLYYNAGAAFCNMGWRKEALEILQKGVEKFPDDQELREFLKEVEDDFEGPDGGEPPPLPAILLLIALIHKIGRKK